ncbi:MAG TPA: DUF438 domain-containing protein [Anaeromyxobacteraceae bacterium]|nr:DUF438 domain-containing protein [Anaeromyxobacteraceae bacterium]
MSELIDNSARRREVLKHLVLTLHAGAAPEQVRTQLQRMLGSIPYGDVVAVEQQLIAEGMPTEEITRLCDLHSAALRDTIQLGAPKTTPPGHPVHTFKKENEALGRELEELERRYREVAALSDGADTAPLVRALRGHFNALMDVEKHYVRKENLLFPYLEKHGITGPPKVMWGKHDEARGLLKGAIQVLVANPAPAPVVLRTMLDRVLRPASSAVAEMIYKEENILLPMCLDTLAVDEWWEIARQSPELGFCLYDPVEAWRPPGMAEAQAAERDGQRIRLPSGSFSLPELTALLNTVPVDMTFVDKDDTVRFFTQGKERVFSRSRAIIGRKVQFCHPPSSVDVVDRILEGFRAGKQDRAEFWIELRGRFVHIEYLAMRGEGGEYLGCLEVSQDLTAKRALTGEQRLLSWAEAQPIPAPPTALDARIAAARCPAPAARPAPAPAEGAAPAWASPEKVTKTLDARPLLAQGLHPVDQVVAELSQLAPGEVFALVTPFVPAPLVERALSLGVAAHSVSESPGVVRTYFARDQ